MKRLALLLILLVVAAASVAGLIWHDYRSAPLAMRESPMRVRIDRGMNVAEIAAALQARGIDIPAWRIALAMRLRGDSRSLRFGVYEFTAPVTLQAMIDRIVRGDVVLAELTIVEGWTFRQMREALRRHPELLHDSASATDTELLSQVGASESQAEGLFFPSTYRFSPGASDYEVYRQAYRLQRRTLDDAWAARAPDLPLASPYEALILASIVEKESANEADRERIAAVFVNRLRRGMLLQSDPTTIYGLGERFDGNLRRPDLSSPTPYNTYVRPGLPPTPIALPGRSAIGAALRPAQSRALYFVARGDGTSEFSENLEAHNRAVARYQLRK